MSLADVHDQASPDSQLHARARAIGLAVFDVDGVLTDGSLWYGPEGEVIKRFNAHDGHGIKMLRDAGMRCAIISGRDSKALQRRAAELGFDRVLAGVQDKRRAWESLLESFQLKPHQSAFMGDDLIDLPVMVRCGLAATVAEAPAAVRAHAHWTATRPAGHGAVREFTDWLLAARGQLDAMIQACLT